MKATSGPEFHLEAELNETLLDCSSKGRSCPERVRTWLDVLQQQPFLAVYTAHSSPEVAKIRENLLELPSEEQTQILIKVPQVHE